MGDSGFNGAYAAGLAEVLDLGALEARLAAA
jgi:hypothetical protein